MLKYGIKIYEKDNTPGFRCSDTWEEWFDTEGDRDKKYDYYTAPPRLKYKEMGNPDSLVEHTYTKIEKEA